MLCGDRCLAHLGGKVADELRAGGQVRTPMRMAGQPFENPAEQGRRTFTVDHVEWSGEQPT